MNYNEYMKSKSFQPFNAVSDYIDFDNSTVQYSSVCMNYESRSIQKFCEKNGIHHKISVYLYAYFVLLAKYGRQNSIVSIVKLNNNEVPFGVFCDALDTGETIIRTVDKFVDSFMEDTLSDISEFTENLSYTYITGFQYNSHDLTDRYIINLNVFENSDNVDIVVDFADGFYEKENMEYFLRHYIHLLDNISNDFNNNFKDINLTDAGEQNIILNTFNSDYQIMEFNTTITDIIEQNVTIFSTKKAVIYENSFLTYQELNYRANALANKLKTIGVNKGDFVVIIPERSLEMIVGIIAILKCEAAYVPVDPKYPDDRITYIVEICDPTAILTNTPMCENMHDVPIIDISDTNDICVENPLRNQSIEDNAYCIFTSGTTGRPKGAVLKHKGLLNLVNNYRKIYDINNNDTLLQFASIAFDQSVWDIFTILGIGGTLCLMPDDLINEPRLLEFYMEKNRVSVAALTPAYIKLLNPSNLKYLRVIESGSAAADYEDMKRWLKGRRVFNTYGPTETTVNSLTYEIVRVDNRVLPIGRPIKNAKAYIMSEKHLCGIGEPGELCIAGYGVSSGYLKLAEKNHEAFVPCPFEDSVMYKTGDLVKYRHDGEILYIGRVDDQIKIRGFRIELGEIENCIKALSYIKDVCIIVNSRTDGEKEIDAYVITTKLTTSESIKADLAKKLTYYMIPSHIYQIDSIPLTINGKVDKDKLKKLPKVRETKCISPATDFEEKALAIFKAVLFEDNIGVTDDFYEIGGTSIKAITIISQLREIGFNYNVRDLLSAKTIRALGNMSVQNYHSNKSDILLHDDKYRSVILELENIFHAKVCGISCLTPSQMYMLEAYRKKIVGDNFLQYFYDCPVDMDINLLEKAISLLPLKNIALTTSIYDDEKPVQIYFNRRSLEFYYYKNSSFDEMNKICEEDIIRGFDIFYQPMVRFKVFQVNQELKMVCSFSHIIVDGWSVELVIQDLSNIYTLLKNGISYDALEEQFLKETSVEKLETCFSLLNDGQSAIAIKYWENYFNNNDIDISYTIPHDNSQNGKLDNWSVVDWIDENQTVCIKEYCRKESISENTFFEMAYAILLAITNRRNEAFFFKVISGRDLPVCDIDNLVGMFINIIPQKINIFQSIRDLNQKLIDNSQYDKFDFYHNHINGKFLMEYGKTFFVFSSYYELSSSIFEYIFDRDQDDVDMSLFVDSMHSKYHILLTGQKNFYSYERMQRVCSLFKDITLRLCQERKWDDLCL